MPSADPLPDLPTTRRRCSVVRERLSPQAAVVKHITDIREDIDAAATFR